MQPTVKIVQRINRRNVGKIYRIKKKSASATFSAIGSQRLAKAGGMHACQEIRTNVINFRPITHSELISKGNEPLHDGVSKCHVHKRNAAIMGAT